VRRSGSPAGPAGSRAEPYPWAVARNDWLEWHQPYDDPESYLSRRLAVVQGAIRDALDAAPAGAVPVVAMCAGQGRDLLGVLADHPRRHDVTARLVELDPRNASAARRRVAELALGDRIEIVEGDAGTTRAYEGALPARLVLACGVFGNISDEDIARTVRALPSLCLPGATVIWTRHRLEPDLTPSVRRWFGDAGFAEVVFHAPDAFLFGVGVHQLRVTPPPFEPGVALFTFVR
jgi:hypothetical protein